MDIPVLIRRRLLAMISIATAELWATGLEAATRPLGGAQTVTSCQMTRQDLTKDRSRRVAPRMPRTENALPTSLKRLPSRNHRDFDLWGFFGPTGA